MQPLLLTPGTLLMQFLAAGNLFLGFGPFNIIWTTMRRICSWWVTHYPIWTPTGFKESVHSRRTRSAVKIWPRAQHTSSQQKFMLSCVWGKPSAPPCLTAWCCFPNLLNAAALLLRLCELSGAQAAHFSQAAVQNSPITEGCKLLGPGYCAALLHLWALVRLFPCFACC